MFPEVPVTTIAEVPAGVPPGVGGGSTVEAAPPPQEEQNAAANIAALGQTILITLLRWLARGLLELNQKIIHAARNATAFQEFCFGLMRNDSGQANEPERLFVVTTTEALEACVPSNVTEDGDTVQVESAGAPEQLNTTTCLNPPLGVTVIVNEADCPALMVALPGLSETPKLDA